MQQIQIVRRGGPEALRCVEAAPLPLPAGHVRVSVNAAGVNFADLQMRMGLYPEAPRLPFVPGFEVAGTVIETGRGVTSVRAGTRVLAACRFGGYASEISLPAFQVRPIPRGLSFHEAASIPIAFVTAWVALIDAARVRAGDRVLVLGAAGGVGCAMVQIAARAGARVVGLVGSGAKKRTVRSLGAAQVFTYNEFANRSGADTRNFPVILDPRGGPGLRDSLRRLAPGGRVVSYGASSLVAGPRRSIPRIILGLLRMPIITPVWFFTANKGVFGLNMLKLFDTEEGQELLRKALDGTLEGFRKGWYRTIIDKVFPLSEAGAAQE